jgi:hypothetical protein
MQARCLAADAGAYLRKPLDGKALLAAIEDAINAASAIAGHLEHRQPWQSRSAAQRE